MRKPLTGKAYFDLMEKVVARVNTWPKWKTGEKMTKEEIDRLLQERRNEERDANP